MCTGIIPINTMNIYMWELGRLHRGNNLNNHDTIKLIMDISLLQSIFYVLSIVTHTCIKPSSCYAFVFWAKEKTNKKVEGLVMH